MDKGNIKVSTQGHSTAHPAYHGRNVTTVPGIHRRRAHRGDFWRHPKTCAEARQNCQPLNLDEPPVRAARRPANLPTTYDDIYRSPTRSWKQHRSVQWKLPKT